jgi:hypothetical protein
MFANEAAALAWHGGKPAEAVAAWDSHSDSVPVLFNRGMAALFTARPKDAAAWLGRAVDGIPDGSAWHHLGKLYLAVAEMRNGPATP